MKIRLFLLTMVLFTGVALGGNKKKTEAADDRPVRLENVRTTAYTHTESDHMRYGRKNAIGTQLRLDKNYSSAAADWSIFPLGTKFKMDGYGKTYVIDDYGSALVGKPTIDIYHPSKRAMNNWGVRHVDIEIIEFGDYEKSREILEERKKWRHCRAMLSAINKMDALPPAGPPSNPVAPQPEPKVMLANVEPAPEIKAPVVRETPKAEPAPEPVPVIKEMAPVPDPEVFLATVNAAVAPAATPEPAPVPDPVAAAPEAEPGRPVELANNAPQSTRREIPPISRDEVVAVTRPEPARPAVYRKRSFVPITLASAL